MTKDVTRFQAERPAEAGPHVCSQGDAREGAGNRRADQDTSVIPAIRGAPLSTCIDEVGL